METSTSVTYMGPRPKKFVNPNFPPGLVETALRAFTLLFGSLPALVAAAIALANTDRQFSPSEDNERFEYLLRKNYSLGSPGFVIALSALTIILEVVVIVVRFLNFGFINSNMMPFSVIIIFLELNIALGYAGGSIANGVAGGALNVSYFGSTMTASLFATCAFCILSSILYVVLAVWDIVFFVGQCNKRLINEGSEGMQPLEEY